MNNNSIEMPETMHSHILHSLSFECRTMLSEIHTCAKLHSRASFGKAAASSKRSKRRRGKPSGIHGPYFINTTLHVCILIKFSTQFFSCSFSLRFFFISFAYRILAFVLCAIWNINEIICLTFYVDIFLWNKPIHFVPRLKRVNRMVLFVSFGVKFHIKHLIQCSFKIFWMHNQVFSGIYWKTHTYYDTWMRVQHNSFNANLNAF